ncbi:Predicted arabinose efflux permease, MFS family [Jatrophihabitans endophyticus]|uniref:Predicted arabinose efflux permease, MFS family n=1 Tax=Jatrophihabitans endophyticus TaxID=1206085 RepID=A0A1M5HPI8_9ACTN|nr:MFS transporter [Jatrophihabitans endophyticus]SHG17861.1 Predicted arabinose efflux permease, MFS family [Jatrophihabitans endophyticus]
MQTDRSTHLDGRRRARRLPDRAAFWLLASVIVAFLAASSAPTPLYATYAAEWHFSPVTTTVVFGVYAISVLVTLLALGRLSDHVGRRPVLLAALAVQLVATAAFLTADGVPGLMAARIVQGIATGAAASAIGAGLIDLDSRRGTLVNAVVTPLGTGLGALGAGVLVQFLPAPTRLVYWLLLGVFAVQAAGVLAMRETVSRAPGAVRSLVPEFALPPPARRALLVATPALIAAWALPSFFASLGPGLVRTVTGSGSVLLGGLPLFLLASAAALSTLLLRNADPDRVMLAGTAGIVLGVAATLVAVAVDSSALFFGTVFVAGLGFGAAFQGGVRTVLPLARPHERAGLLSLVYVVSYLALGIPAMIGGLLAVHNADLPGTAREYGLAVIVLALLAAASLLVRGRADRSAPVVVEQLCPRETARQACPTS